MTEQAFRPYPLTFEPRILTKVWGGTKLTTLFGKPASDDPKGESWEVSAVEGDESVVDAGPLEGKRLDELVRTYGAELVGDLVTRRHGNQFPLLLKLLDASDDLSVQVHPNHEQAARLGGGAQSKSEAWLILHVDPGARLVHGVAPGIDRAKFEELVETGRIEECLRFVEVKPGDVVPVSPGTLHAIGKGVVLLELQESSDTTYRFYDYGRLGLDGKPRELHVEQALAVVSLENIPATTAPSPIEGPGHRELLYGDDALIMERWTFEKPIELGPDSDRFWLLTILEGTIDIESDSPIPVVELSKGRSGMIPAGLKVTLNPKGKATVFLGTVPEE